MAGTVILHLTDKRQGEIQQLARVTQLEKGEELGFEPRQTDSQGTSQEDLRESGPVRRKARAHLSRRLVKNCLRGWEPPCWRGPEALSQLSEMIQAEQRV